MEFQMDEFIKYHDYSYICRKCDESIRPGDGFYYVDIAVKKESILVGVYNHADGTRHELRTPSSPDIKWCIDCYTTTYPTDDLGERIIGDLL